MNLTKELKQWLVEHCGVKADASDDEFKTAVSSALADGSLSPSKFAELSKDVEAEQAKGFMEKLDALVTQVKGLHEKHDALETKTEEKAAPVEQKETKTEEKKTEPATKAAPSKFSKMVADLGGMSTDGEKTVDVRVKEAAEMYRTDKSTLTYPSETKTGKPHALAGMPVKDFDRTMQTASEQDAALAGAWAKFQIAAASHKIAGNATMAWNALPEHDKELLCFLTEKGEWDDSGDGRLRSRKGYQGGIKALIDDAVSGGIEAAPIVFDDMVISTPLLHGELFPLVNTVPIDRGRRIEGVEVANVTGNWGGIDDTAISLFNTNSYVTEFNTTIYRWEGAIRVGLDFMSDTPIDFGQIITAQYGERLLEDLDDVIAAGNGTTQPEGIAFKAGTTGVTFGGTTTLGNYESLRFGVSKAEHRPNVRNTAVFLGTETSYQRARAIPVGASDARRLGGMNYDSYAWMERPYKINESLTNAQIIYVILARYRMYRRRGLAIRSSTEGDTLIRNNSMLIVAMARYGGQLERGAVAAVTNDAPI